MKKPRCRYRDCHKNSEYFAIDNRAEFGHLCIGHYRGYIPTSEQELMHEQD